MKVKNVVLLSLCYSLDSTILQEACYSDILVITSTSKCIKYTCMCLYICYIIDSNIFCKIISNLFTKRQFSIWNKSSHKLHIIWQNSHCENNYHFISYHLLQCPEAHFDFLAVSYVSSSRSPISEIMNQLAIDKCIHIKLSAWHIMLCAHITLIIEYNLSQLQAHR